MKISDLSTLSGQWTRTYLTDLNNAGQAVGVLVPDDAARTVAILTTATRRTVEVAHPGAARPAAINDNGAVVGWVEGVDGQPGAGWKWREGETTLLGPHSPSDITDRGVIAAGTRVLYPDGSFLDLRGTESRPFHATAINEAGQVAGSIRLPGDESLAYRTFRTAPGEPLDFSRDHLRYGDYGEGEQRDGWPALAYAMNERGEVAGYGRDAAEGGHVPLIWDAEGNVARPATPAGGHVLGINDAGIGVGFMADRNGQRHAAIFRDGAGEYLELVLPEESPWVLDEALDINNENQVIGYGRLKGDLGRQRAFLLDLDLAQGPMVEHFTAEQRDYPSGQWIPLEKGETYDGNIVRLRAQVRNTSSYPAAVAVDFRDTAGDLLDGGRFEETIMPGQAYDYTVEVDTAGGAWSAEGKPRTEPQTYSVHVSTGSHDVDARETSVLVRPRPVVLVHGYKSDATSSWGEYPAILASGHPLLRGYAVGDGQFDGKMNTGSLAAPFDPTNTIEENAVEEGVYIHDLRSRLDAWHIDLVAHSMGGLISRYYIQELMPAPPSDGRPVVNRLIQLGTPNMGSPCADVLLALFAGSPTGPPLMPATLQLSRPAVNWDFNERVTNLRGVRISNLAGQLLPIPCGTSDLGDSVVPDHSAAWSLSDVVATLTWHIGMTENLEDFAKYVLPRLKQPPVPASGEHAPRAATTPPPGAPTAPVFATDQGAVEAGQSRTIALPVPPSSEFGITTVLPNDTTLHLVDPGGRTHATIEPRSEQAAAPFQGLRVTTPTPGSWTVRVENGSDEAVKVPLVAWVEGSAFTAELEATAGDTGRVTVTATVTHDRSPTTADVTATLVTASGERFELDLLDDGQHDDGAAGDGTYGATTPPLPDGQTVVVVTAETDAGVRIDTTALRVAAVDRSPKTLTLTSQPGGSATASPPGPTHEHGSTVVVDAAPVRGEMHQGWLVDGEHKPAGPLRLTMDRHHDVVALFGHYTVTELPALPGGRRDETRAWDINNRGEVVLEVTERTPSGPSEGVPRAAVYRDGKLRVLPGLPCDVAWCEQRAYGINDAGDVVGAARARRATGGHALHAALWRDGTVIDLHPDDPSAWDSVGRSIGDNGQVLGGYERSSAPPVHGVWTNQVFRPFGNQSLSSDGVVNARGRIALEWRTYSSWGHVTRVEAARYAAGKAAKLPHLPQCAPHEEPSSDADGINAAGTIVGTANCGINSIFQRAVVWRDGAIADLGEGLATAVNDGELVVGSRWDGDYYRPVLWTANGRMDLEDYVPAACPKSVADTVTPCFDIVGLTDVNNEGRIIASGYFRDKGTQPGTWVQRPRAFLLSPSHLDADLSVVQEAPLDQVAPGALLTRKVTVSNDGPDPATGVVIDLELPEHLVVTGCTAPEGGCTELATGRRVVVDAIGPGQTTAMTVTARVSSTAPPTTKISTAATAFSRAVRDLDQTDNIMKRTVSVQPMIDTGILWPDPVAIGTTSHPVTRRLTNRSEEAMTITGITATDGFSVSDDCPAVLASGATCDLTVVFAPTEVRDYTGAVSIASTPTGPLTMSVSGTGKEYNAAPEFGETAPQSGVVGSPFSLHVPFSDADLEDTHTAQIVWPNSWEPVPVDSVEYADGAGVIIARRTFDAPVSEGRAIVILTDSAGNSALTRVAFSIAEKPVNDPPVVLAGGDAALVAGESLGRRGSFVDSGSTAWTATVDFGEGEGPQPLGLSGGEFDLNHVYTRPGRYAVTVTVTDDGGLAGSGSFDVVVTRPNTSPEITIASSAAALEGGDWTLSGQFTDPDSDTWSGTVDFGDGTVEELPLEGSDFTLRHRWSDDGQHTVRVTITDSGGAHASAVVTVDVSNLAPSLSVGAPSRGAVVAVGATVALQASFSDPGTGDTHAAAWQIEGTTVATTVTGAGGVGTVAAQHTFTHAGRYRLSLSLTDDDGATVIVDDLDGAPWTLTVVDPDSRIEGRGAFSAPGACTPDPGCGGSRKASFALTARYEPGSLRSVGEVRVTHAGLQLVGNDIDVVFTRGNVGVVEGSGVVDGETPVRFKVTTRASGRGGHAGQLRLQIWDAVGQEVIYDNAPRGLTDDAGAVTGWLRIDR